MATHKSRSLFDAPILRRAILDAFRKLDPRLQVRNPVMFVVFIGSILTTILFFAALAGYLEPGAVSATTNFGPRFILGVTLWLWFTVLFANFAEAMAEGRGKAQADTLRKSRRDTPARKIRGQKSFSSLTPADIVTVSAASLRKGDLVLCEAGPGGGDHIPADGEVLEGVASVDESAITGESAPVIRESGGDRSSVTGGTRVLSDWLIIQISVNPGEAFLDRMISMVEGAKRQKTPNEIALNILLASFTIVCLLATATLLPYSLFATSAAGHGTPVTVTILCALLVCLIPTTIGGLLSAIGIAGMDRMIQANVIAMSGRAVEAAGDVDDLLLDKTGTITLGNRQAVAFHPADGISDAEVADAAQLSSLADETPEGRSVVILAKDKYKIRERHLHELDAHFVPFTAQTRMSGVNFPHREIRKGAAAAIEAWVESTGGHFPPTVKATVDTSSKKGGTPLVIAEKVGPPPPRGAAAQPPDHPQQNETPPPKAPTPHRTP
ncbi:MAG: potassium-transporting ATPase subunit KdpB, partial [Phycisphaerae bacterium]